MRSSRWKSGHLCSRGARRHHSLNPSRIRKSFLIIFFPSSPKRTATHFPPTFFWLRPHDDDGDRACHSLLIDFNKCNNPTLIFHPLTPMLGAEILPPFLVRKYGKAMVEIWSSFERWFALLKIFLLFWLYTVLTPTNSHPHIFTHRKCFPSFCVLFYNLDRKWWIMLAVL